MSPLTSFHLATALAATGIVTTLAWLSVRDGFSGGDDSATTGDPSSLSTTIGQYGRSLRVAYAAGGTTPPTEFWSEWLNRIEDGMATYPDDPLRQQGWSIIISIHNQLDEPVEAFEAAWVGLGEAVEARDVAARCADVIAGLPSLASSDDPDLLRLAGERREHAYARLWDLIGEQRNDQNPAPAEWMNPTTRSCFANQFAFLRDRGELQGASELEMALAIALSLPDFRDYEGLHAGDHALNAVLQAPAALQNQLSVSFIDVMETKTALRDEQAFFVGALFGSTSVDPLPFADRLMPFIANAQTPDQVFAMSQLSRRLSSHPDADELSPGHDRWRQVAAELLAVSELAVLLPAERALADLSASSPSHPDVPGVFSDARTSALLLAVKLEDNVKRDIAYLILKDGYGMESLAENVLQ